MVSCALSGTTAYCFEPFCLENHTLDGRGDCARVCVIQALRTSSVTVNQLGSGGPVGPADVRLGVAHHSESKRHMLPSGLLSLLGHANLVALNMADVRIQGWGGGWGDAAWTGQQQPFPIRTQKAEGTSWIPVVFSSSSCRFSSLFHVILTLHRKNTTVKTMRPTTSISCVF